MSRTVPALIVVAAVVVAVVASPLAVATGVGDGFSQTTPAGADDADAGAKLAGVVGSEGAEIEGDFQERSFNASIANASSAAAKAAVVASAQGTLSDRLADLRERKAALTERYENGSMSRGEYQARLARLGAQIQTLTSMANRTSDAARDLPTEALEAKGVNVTALENLRQNAANLSGPEVAAAARNLTRGGPPAGLGPDGERGKAKGNGADGRAGQKNVTTGQNSSQAAPANASDGANAGERGTGAAEKGSESSRADAAVTENGSGGTDATTEQSGATDRENGAAANSRRPTATPTSTPKNATATR